MIRLIDDALKIKFTKDFLDYSLSNSPDFGNFWQEYCYEKLDVEDFRIIRNSEWYCGLGIDEAGSTKPYQNPRIQSCISRYFRSYVWTFVTNEYTIYDFLSRISVFLLYGGKVRESDSLKVVLKLANFLYKRYEQDTLARKYFND